MRVARLAAFCDAELNSRFMRECQGNRYLDMLTYRYYETSCHFKTAIAQGQTLKAFVKPVYLDEYGHKTYWSNGTQGALWHSFTLSQLWDSGINPVQFCISEFPGVQTGYNELGLFKDWNSD